MPIRLKIDASRQRVDAVVEGDVTAADAIAAFEALVRAPGLEGGFRLLSDHRKLTRGFSQTEVNRLTEWMEGHIPALGPTRWAAVVSRPTAYGLMRVLGARAKLAVGLEVGVFTSLAAGEEWLATPQPGPGTRQ